MYAEVHTLAKNELDSPLITTQVGFSSGIPYIKYFGDISSRYVRSREKVPFIFSYLGRKLPQRKIRIAFSADNYIADGLHLDLAVITGVYLAHNDVGFEKKVYCFGEVDMNGVVKPADGLEKLLWKLRDIEDDHVILIPEELIYFKNVYPSLDIIPLKNIASLFAYFEGGYDPSSDPSPAIKRSSWTEKVDVSLLLTLKERKSILILGDQRPIKKGSISRLAEIAQTEKQITSQVNTILQPNDQEDGVKKFISINSEEQLDILRKLSIPQECKMMIFVDKLDLSKLNDKQFEFLKEMFERHLLIANISECPCSYLYERCICTTTQLAKYRNRLSEIAKRSFLIIDGSYKIESDQKVAIDNDLDIDRLNETLANKQIDRQIINEIKNSVIEIREKIVEDL